MALLSKNYFKIKKNNNYAKKNNKALWLKICKQKNKIIIYLQFLELIQAIKLLRIYRIRYLKII
jgi:hypothetical protein